MWFLSISKSIPVQFHIHKQLTVVVSQQCPSRVQEGAIHVRFALSHIASAAQLRVEWHGQPIDTHQQGGGVVVVLCIDVLNGLLKFRSLSHNRDTIGH
jgi:hypothetical protein